MSLSIATKFCKILTDCVLFCWNRYKRRNPGASPHHLKTTKHFMEGVVHSCCAGEKESSMYYMLQKWTDFGASWKWWPGNDKIPSDVLESTFFVCTQSPICSSFLPAGADDLTSMYKLSYTRSSTFQQLSKLGTSWQWTTLLLWSNTCEWRIDINTDMEGSSFRITLPTCFSSVCLCE